MLTIEDKIKMEEEAREAKGKTGRDEATGKFPPLPPVPKVAVTSSKEIAERLAKKAGVGKTSVYSRKAVLEKGAPELIDLMESGEIGADRGEIFAKAIPDKD